MNIGQKIVTLYFILVYLMPLLGNFFFQKNIFSHYKIYPITNVSVYYILGTYLLFLALSLFFSFKKFRINFAQFSITRNIDLLINKYLGYRFRFSLVFLVASLVYFFSGFASYRYGSQGISDIHSPLLVLGILIESILILDFFYILFISPKKELKSSKKIFYTNIINSLSLILLSGGTGSAFIAFLFLFYSIFYNKFNNIIFSNSSSFSCRSFFNFAKSILTIGLVIIIAWNYGEAVKSVAVTKNPSALLKNLIENFNGKAFKAMEIPTPNNNAHIDLISDDKAEIIKVNESLENFKLQRIENYEISKEILGAKQVPYYEENLFGQMQKFIYYFIERNSIHYYSLLYTINEKPKFIFSPVFYPLNNMLFRFNYIFFLGGLEYAKPEIGSLSRLNYQLVAKEATMMRAGASPGTLASFNYIFTFPFNIILCSLFLFMIASIINKLFFNYTKKLSFFAIFLIYLFFESIFSSPFDFLIIFDPNLLRFILILFVFISCCLNNEIQLSRDDNLKQTLV